MTGRSRRAGTTIAAAMLACALVVGTTAAAPRAAAVAPPSKRLYVVTDSVGLGAENWFPQAFPGWDVILDGDAGEFTETMARRYVAPRAAAGQLGDYALVATGYNYPYWDPDRFDRSIDEMIATLMSGGVEHVLWVTLREVKPQYVTASAWRQIQPYYWYFPTVNDHLEAALLRHPNLTLVDWAAVADQPGLTYDAIHLNAAGSALYTSIARQAVIDATTAAPAGSVTVIEVPGGGLGAVTLNLTTTAPRAAGYLTAYPCGDQPPQVSTHNYARAQVVAHAAVVPVPETAQICIFTPTATNVIADLTGRFLPTFVDATTPTRLIDTRDGGGRQPADTQLAVTLDPGTAAAALSVTAVDAAGPGWVRAAPCESTATTSTVNVIDAAPVPNIAVVAPGDDGTICVTASVATHLIVDRLAELGYDEQLVAAAPRRLVDTREMPGTALAAGGTLVVDAASLDAPTGAGGVMLNLTATDAAADGFLTAYPCDAGTPATSSLNYTVGSVVANFVTVAPDADGDVCIDTLAETHVVVDLLGFTGATFVGGAPQRLLDTRLANLPPDWP